MALNSRYIKIIRGCIDSFYKELVLKPEHQGPNFDPQDFMWFVHIGFIASNSNLQNYELRKEEIKEYASKYLKSLCS